MKSNNLSFKLVLFLFILFVGIGAGCNVNNGEKPPVTPPDTTQSNGNGNDNDNNKKYQPPNYVSLIQNHTNLIKTVKFDSTYSTPDGFYATAVRYINKNNKPLALFFLTVNLSNQNISLQVGTAYNKTDFRHQTVSGMITYKNRADPFRTAIAGVNGDYWAVQSDVQHGYGILGHPLGIEYKNGLKIKGWPPHPPGGSYCFFAILNNKTAYMGSKSAYFLVKNKIVEATGARFFLVKNGVNVSASLSKYSAPRTAVGLLSKTKVVFIVVDGRAQGYSVGVSKQTLAKMFMAIGVTDALNLDGGGSSTFVLKLGSNYVVMNRPSDGQERAVDNAWLVMYKND